MLPRHEKRLLDEIEHHLRAEDPGLGRLLSDDRVLPRFLGWLSVARVLALVAVALAVTCAVSGDGSGFATAGVLAAVLFWFAGRSWHIDR